MKRSTDDTIAEVMYILKSHRIDGDSLKPGTKLDQAGMDSLLFLDVVLAVEQHFKIVFSSEMMVPENFQTPLAIADAVTRMSERPASYGNTVE